MEQNKEISLLDICNENLESATICERLLCYDNTLGLQDFILKYGKDMDRILNYGCSESISNFLRFLNLYNYGVFEDQHIKQNMQLDFPVIFIDNNIFNNYLSCSADEDKGAGFTHNEQLPYSTLTDPTFKRKLIDSFNKRWEERKSAFGNGEPGSGK